MANYDEGKRTRTQRMQWWEDARFGMFVHWGLYSILGRHEWGMNRERIPKKEYEKLADQFKPKPRSAREFGLKVGFYRAENRLSTPALYQTGCRLRAASLTSFSGIIFSCPTLLCPVPTW